MTYDEITELEKHYLATNYSPLPVLFVRGDGVWLYDSNGKEYLDMLASYSAVSQGHCHPRLIKALVAQATKLTLTSRVFHSETLGPLAEKLCLLSGLDKVLPMNTGAEAVETAFKAARRWGYQVKGIEKDKAEIIVCRNNFHGRTMTAVSLSTDPQYRADFGPFLPNIVVVDFNNVDQLKKAITKNTAAFIVEPIQGEGGIIVPDESYLPTAYEVCRDNNVLFICDEVQTGLGRTGRMFAFQHYNIQPDGITLGKALSGGMFPISAFVGTNELMSVFNPGDHGSTFGGSALAGAVALEALRILEQESLVHRAQIMGTYLLDKLMSIKSDLIVDVRGQGLLVGIELDTNIASARFCCEQLLKNGIVSKDTHDKVLRFAPPLTISIHHIDYCADQIETTFNEITKSRDDVCA